MKEGDFTSKLLSNLRKEPTLVGAWVPKHSDYFTAGIPDFHITSGPLSTWFEVKVRPNEPTALQLATLRKCAPRAYVLYVGKDGKDLTLYSVSYKGEMALVYTALTMKEMVPIIAQIASYIDVPMRHDGRLF